MVEGQVVKHLQPQTDDTDTGSRLRLLLVDDDETDREIIGRALKRCGLSYHLSEARTGRQGLERLQSEHFDCALIDLNLPDGNSLERFAGYLATPGVDKPGIVLITGDGNEKTAATAIQIGVQEYLTKSEVSASSIRRTIEQALEKASLSRQLAQRESELLQMSFYDRLTNLPNRNLFFDRLKQTLLVADRQGEEFAVMTIDLDRFKQVNDEHGHQVGDKVLVRAAERLLAPLRDTDTVARFGGDEFTVLMPNSGREGALRAAKAICALFSEPFVVDDKMLSIGTSVGVAMYPRHGADADTLLNNSDDSMYEAKQRGGGFSICAPGLVKAGRKRRDSAQDLATALCASDQLFLEYQPQLSLDVGSVVGVEALIRWRHPERGLLSPAHFIPIAERSPSSIETLTWFVVRTALAQMKQWQDDGHNFNLSLNLSPMVIERPGLVAVLHESVLAHGVEPSRLCLEVTETALMNNVLAASDTLHQLKQLGYEVSIDDFGTGYSSLKNLRDFPIDEIKIDRMFVAGMDSQDSDRIIVESVLALGRAFGVRVVAEGIEDDCARRSLLSMGC